MNIKLTKEINPNLRHLWEFYFMEGTLYLDRFTIEEKEKGKRKFRRNGWYYRLNQRECTMKESEVLLTDGIKQEALNQFIKSLTVKKWSER